MKHIIILPDKLPKSQAASYRKDFYQLLYKKFGKKNFEFLKKTNETTTRFLGKLDRLRKKFTDVSIEIYKVLTKKYCAPQLKNGLP